MSWGGREGGTKKPKIQTLEDLDFRAKQADRSIRSTLVRRFSGFGNRNDAGGLPYRWDIGGANREVEQMGKEANSKWTKMLQMKDRHPIWASRSGIFTPFNRVNCIFLRERSERAVQRVIYFDVFMNFPSFFILLKLLNVCILLAKSVRD